MVNHSTHGLNGVTSEAIKGLDAKHREILYRIIHDYFNNKIDIKELQEGNLRTLPKKGDLSTPHKW